MSAVENPRAARDGSAGRRRGATWLGIALAVALVAGACGSDRSTVPTDTVVEQDAPAGQAFGTLPSPCGEGDATGATDQGVTDASITIGFGDDAGYQGSPGLFHEISDATRAMIDWCNDQGGINGRQVDGIYYDAKLFDVNNVMTEACSQVFMLVGQGWSLDSGQEELRRGCALPSVPGYTASPAFANGPLMVQAVPNPFDYTPVQIAAAFQQMFPDEIKKSSVVFGNFASTIDAKDKVLQAYPKFGFEFLDCPQEYPIAGAVDWKPSVQKLKDCGAEVVYFVGAPYPTFQNFLDAANQLDYDPLYVTDANFYDASFGAWNVNGYADKVYIRQAFTPFFEAASSPATQQYLDIVGGAGGDVSQSGQQAASSFLLWATAAQSCGSVVTRDCVMTYLGQVTEWDGGGMHAVANPGENLPPECGLVLKLQGTEFVRVLPEGATEFACDPSYVVQVTGAVVERANLDANRISQLG